MARTCTCGSTNIAAEFQSGGGSGFAQFRCRDCAWTWHDTPTKEELGAAVTVPDVMDDVIGWRAWNVITTTDGPRLASQGYGGSGASGLWIPGEPMHALCTRGGGHRSPDEGCSCGYYAARTREHLMSLDSYHRYDRSSHPVVMGELQMWGKVIPATLGWRAEIVYPKHVRVPYEFWQLVNPLKEAYGESVDFTLETTLVLPKTDEPRWCRYCGSQMKDRNPKCGFCEKVND